ncbi:MAG TPA: hypothetical protein VF801_12840 [Rhodocyclaceae bacterium]
MPYFFHVRTHPLGVVVSRQPELLGELLLPGEQCCGIEYAELARAAETTGRIEVPEEASQDCPLKQR